MASKNPIIGCKYVEGEKVLCYEPDPAKTRVLYDSKVVKIVQENDDIGHKDFKFLIHFQGWNSTWDRYVTDEFVLKDTEENRKLQKKLADEAQLTPGGNLYRRERKKRTKNEAKSSSSLEPAKKSVKKESPKKSAVESNGTSLDYSDTILLPKRRLPDLKFPDNLKYHTGYNCYLTHDKNMLIRLPCSPSVVTLLEHFLKYLARNFYFIDKKSNKGSTRHKNEKFDRKEIEKRYKLCIEFLDGLRICFNTYLNRRLLINEEERAQFQEAIKIKLKPPVTIIQESYEPEFTHVQNGRKPDTEDNEDNVRRKGKQENTLSSISQSSKICSDCGLTDTRCSQVFDDLFKKVRDVNISKADQWKAVPDSVYYEEKKQPAIIYGAYHLLRLLEQLPKLLTFTEIEGERLSVVYSFSNELLNYLSTQTQLFGMENYLNAEGSK